MSDANLMLMATTEFTRLAELPEAVGVGGPDDQIAIRQLRVRLLVEEFKEYIAGEGAVIDDNPGNGETQDVWFAGPPDPTEIADGLADIIVIAWGTLLTYFGEDAAIAICREVWSTNLAKVDGSLGPIQRRADGKLLKPPGWTPPDIASVLRRHGFLT